MVFSGGSPWRPWLVGVLASLGFVLSLAHGAWAQKVPPGFKVELLFKAPDIEHPSTVTCDDDGNLFVGEDPMDMRGPSTKPIDRIIYLRWDKNGGPPRKTIFCDKLSAVFGMAWHEGGLYVMHAPYFSLFKDTDGDGVADFRKDFLTNLGHPAGKFGLNNHQPTGIQLGMDGLIYVSVGDKGVPKATGADGSTITLEGGGIIRMKPDGTKLEVVSSGIRNHLDLALDSFDNIFAYENDDDIGWPVQMFHHIPTGYFGYPYYRKSRPAPRLPPVAVLGDGTPCGAASYRETAWPAKYHERVFFGEWGKGKIECFTFQPKGASFELQVEDFFIGDSSGDFHPIDLCFSPDGKHMYVADWNLAAGGKSDKVGRLYRVTYGGNAVPAEPPRARSTDPLAGQLRSLGHPSRHERMRAQYRLIALGKAAADPVAKLLTANVSHLVKAHAIWTLNGLADQLPGFDPSPAWLQALRDPDAEVRAQAARALGYRRIPAAAGQLAKALQDHHAAVRMQAAIALGRIGRPVSVIPLLQALGETDTHTQFAMIQALRAINHWESVLTHLSKGDKQVRAAIVQTLTGVYDVRAVQILAQWVQKAPDMTERVAALEGLAEVHRQADPYTSGWWGPKPAAGNFARPKIHIWAGTQQVESAIAAALGQTAPAVRLAAVQALREVPAPAVLPALRRLVRAEADESLRREALLTLVACKDQEIVPTLLDMADDGKTSDALRQEAIRAAVTLRTGDIATRLIRIAGDQTASAGIMSAALDGLAALKTAAAAEAVQARLTDPRVEVRLKAIQACVPVCGKAAASRLVGQLQDKELAVRRAALEAMAKIGSAKEVPALLTAFVDPQIRYEALLALAAIPDQRALPCYLDGLQHKNADARTACRRALGKLGEAIRPALLVRHQRNELPMAARRELQTVFTKQRPAFAFLFETAATKLEAGQYTDFATRHRGDVTRGRQLFADLQGTACIKCHAIRGEGGTIGPDLSGVGVRYPRPELIRSILDPSNRIVDGYELTIVVTTSGAVHQGIVKSQTPEKTVLLTVEGQTIDIRANDIEEQRKSTVSPMPNNLVDGLTLQDFADLIGYLESLKDPAKK